MFYKWIVCQVPTAQKKNFSTAQEKWGSLINSKGFLCQFGGWNIHNSNEACILSIWESKKDLDYFMKYEHDFIYHKIQQKHTYSSISIKFFEEIESSQEFSFDLTKEFILIKGIKIKLVPSWTVLRKQNSHP